MYLYKVITAAIALKIDQPVLILEREGLPIDIYSTISINSDRGVTCDHLSEILLSDNRSVTSDNKQLSDKS